MRIKIIDVIQLPNRVRLSGMAYAEAAADNASTPFNQATKVSLDLKVSLAKLDNVQLPLQDAKERPVAKALFCPGSVGWLESDKGQSRVRVDRWITKRRTGGCDVEVDLQLTNASLEYMAFWVELEFEQT